MLVSVTVYLVVLAVGILADIDVTECVYARTNAGWVCGTYQKDIKGDTYASFLNVPYAKQPVGELRFKELQPADPWQEVHDSTKLGPICPQIDPVFGSLMTNKNMSEACIHANIYVPLRAFENVTEAKGRPVLVFIHGGGFDAGSGDPDIYGPEYLMPEGIIVMTFNYRLGAIGYMSLFTSSIPGNNGLRDCLTFLRWVKDNAKYFGGNPNDVTLGGHSAGGSNAHLLLLSKAAEGLFKRVITLSGVSYRSYFTTSTENAKKNANYFISILGIHSTDPEVISKELINTPLDKLLNATMEFQKNQIVAGFTPVIEQSFPGITTVVEDDPSILLTEGQGRNIPQLIGFTNKEEEFALPNYTEADVITIAENEPLELLSPDLVYRIPYRTALEYANKTERRYFRGDPTVQKFGRIFGDFTTRYPAIKVEQIRKEQNGRLSPDFLYKFSYNLSFSVVKESKHTHYNGAAHLDDLSLIFRVNSMRGKPGFDNPTARDVDMRENMVKIITNFMKYNDPYPNSILRFFLADSVMYLDIKGPNDIKYSDLTLREKGMVHFYDKFWKNAKALRKN